MEPITEMVDRDILKVKQMLKLKREGSNAEERGSQPGILVSL
jgi:hypothetical protein